MKTIEKTIQTARAYFEAKPGAVKTQGHVNRMMNELVELDTRTEALHSFTGTEVYKGLDAEERTDMYDQWRHMVQYRAMLSRRLNRALDKLA